jgi:4-carboxymuconolactone decarboxylase
MNSHDGVSGSTRRARGNELRARAQGARTDELSAALAAVDPDLVDWADSFIFGTVWSNEGIAFEDRMLVAITALAARGDVQQLRTYLHGALQAGMDPRRLREALKMLVIYCGFPTGIRSLSTLGEVEAAHARSTSKDA